MIKKYLLKLAHAINKRYGAIEIKYLDWIKFGDNYFGIARITVDQQIGHTDCLHIEAHGIIKP